MRQNSKKKVMTSLKKFYFMLIFKFLVNFGKINYYKKYGTFKT